MMSLFYKIADLITEIPTADGLDIRCKDYKCDEVESADIIIRTELYRREKFDPTISAEIVAEVESGYQFYLQLINYDGFYLHSSAVVKDGKAYLFSGPCGVGKSTHTRLWQECFGEEAYVINDDKPALRRIDGKWYVYGTPWCGKDGINRNEKALLAGVCFLKQGKENKIRHLSPLEAMQRVLPQTLHKFRKADLLNKMMQNMDHLLSEIPVYELENRPEVEAAKLSYETMCKGAREAGI